MEFAADGGAALDKTRQLKPDVLLSEILISSLDGLALCRRIKSAPETRHVPVVLMSVLAATSRALDAGADAFLLKPLSQERLVDEVRRLVSRAQPAMGKRA